MRCTIAMILRPFPRLVGPICAPPPLAIAKVASMKHRWRYQSKRAATPHHGTSSGSDDVRSYNSDSIAAACATARQCSKSKEQLPTHGAPEPVSGQAVPQQWALPESVSGCAPTARPSAESSALYSRSTRHRNFEIGSRAFSLLIESEP